MAAGAGWKYSGPAHLKLADVLVGIFAKWCGLMGLGICTMFCSLTVLSHPQQRTCS